jgi:hypothetical protein
MRAILSHPAKDAHGEPTHLLPVVRGADGRPLRSRRLGHGESPLRPTKAGSRAATVPDMSRTPPHIALAVAIVAFVASIVIAAAAVGIADARPAGPASAAAAAGLSDHASHIRAQYVAPAAIAAADPLTGSAPWYVA